MSAKQPRKYAARAAGVTWGVDKGQLFIETKSVNNKVINEPNYVCYMHDYLGKCVSELFIQCTTKGDCALTSYRQCQVC